MRIRQSLLQPYICWAGKHRSPGRGWSWELGLRDYGAISRAAVDYGETDRGDVREEMVVGNICGEKSSSHGSKAIQLSHVLGVNPPP